jgi:glycosyltransferase involved in cell wall biosynthesis
MVNDFRGCSFIPFIFNYKYHIHLNIVTGSVSPSALSRFIYNLLIRWESYFFRNVSVISEGLKKTLKLSHNAFILPLGADPMMIKRHCTHKLSLLYIGILSDRRIDDTIEGIAIFVRKNPDFDIHYTIIGYGWSGAEEILMKKIVSGKLEKYVDLKDYVPHSELIHFFEKANVGISYIPITPYFDYQPATKTFEYLMAGLPVIATGTYENKNIINNQNGIIIDDTPESFADSLDYLTENITSFNEKIIKGTVIGYDWETIVEKLKGIINNLNEDEENRRV